VCAERRTFLPLVLAAVAFGLFMPVVCVGSSDDSRLGCDTLFGWTLPGSGTDGPEILIYVVPAVVAVTVFVVARILRGRKGRSPDAATSRS
jgi:ABC-type branched-subunit amino acid transport system permease subunit